MDRTKWLMTVAVAVCATTLSRGSQVAPEPNPLPDSDSGQQLHGPPGLNQWTVHAKMCKDTERCPTRSKLSWNWVQGEPCNYCDLNVMQSRCWGGDGDCTQVKYTAPAAPPNCGVFWFGGTVNAEGNCVGAVASSTQVCYRLTCSNGIPEAQ